MLCRLHQLREREQGDVVLEQTNKWVQMEVGEATTKIVMFFPAYGGLPQYFFILRILTVRRARTRSKELDTQLLTPIHSADAFHESSQLARPTQNL